MGATDRFLKRGRIQDFSRGPIAKMLSELKKFGANGHLYIPGVGAISGITAGNYLDSVGVTGASVDGNVGLVLDGAGIVGNEMFSDGQATPLGESSRISSGVYRVYSSAGTYSGVTINGVGAGKAYRVEFTIDSISALGAGVLVDTTATTFTTIGRKSIVITPSTSSFPIKRGSGATDIQISGVSVKEITGIHASQATTGYQPKLRRGLVNYQLNSVPIGGQWVAEATGTGVVPAVTYNYATAPDGSSAARAILDKGVGATSADLSQFRAGNSTVVPGATYTSAIWLRTTVEGAMPAVSIRDNIAASTITVTDQWQLFVRSGNAISAIMSVGVHLRPSEATSSQADILVGAAGIFQGTLTAAQILAAGGIPVTATAPASSPAGAYKWELDGVDDSMSLGVVPFQMSDDHCVIAMGNNLAGSGTRYIIDFGSTGSANPICGSVGFSNSAVVAQWRDDAGTANLLSGGNFPLGTQAVVTARKVGNSFSLRANGAQVIANLSTLSTTTLTGAKLGVRVFGSNLYQGVISGVVVIKGTVSAAQALIFERGLNALSQYAAGRF